MVNHDFSLAAFGFLCYNDRNQQKRSFHRMDEALLTIPKQDILKLLGAASGDAALL